MKVIKALRPWYDQFNHLFPNREDVINAALLCLVAKHNLLLIGESGAGKTKLLEMVLESLFCDDIFYLQVNRFCRREEIIGMNNPKIFRETGEQVLQTEGFLPEARYALLDEFLSINPHTGRVVLGVIHPYEHMLRLGNDVRKCPLETCFATSNFFTAPDEDREMKAVYERFACIMHVDGSISKKDEIKVYKNHRKELEHYLESEVLQDLQEKTHRMEIPDTILSQLSTYRSRLSDTNQISVRTGRFALDLAQAAAAVTGKDEVTLTDLDQVVPYTFSVMPDDALRITSKLALAE